MTRRELVSALLAAACVGCGRRGGIVEDAEPVSVELTEPWLSMGLPLGEGNVLFSNAHMLTLDYPRGTVPGLRSTFTGALTAQGWTHRLDTSSEQMVSVSLVRGGSTVVLGIFPGFNGLTVTLTLYPSE